MGLSQKNKHLRFHIMNKKKYLTSDALRFGFKMFRKHCYFLFKLSLVTGLLLWGMTALVYIIHCGFVTHNDFRMIIATLHGWMSGGSEHLKLDGLVAILVGLFIIPFFLGISDMIGSKIAVMLYDDKDISRKDIVACWRRIPTYFGLAYMCSSVAKVGSYFFIGFEFLIQVLYKPCKYFVVDKNVGIDQALRGSWNISRGHILDMCMVSMIMVSFGMTLHKLSTVLCASIMSNIVALMIACYTTYTCIFINACVYAFFYRKLLEEKQMQLIPANVINENYNPIPTPDKETLQL